MAKLTRESRLRERRLDKQARKDARKRAAEHPELAEDASNTTAGEPGEPGEPDASGPVADPVVQAPAEA